VENTVVRSRHHAEHTVCVKAFLHVQILWPNPSDPNYVTSANWDPEGVSIADRYAHRQRGKAHWLLDIADTYRVYNFADCRNVTPPACAGNRIVALSWSRAVTGQPRLCGERDLNW
jgi:hypothetical protein